MKRRMIGPAAGAALACLLYFFENNTGTRITAAFSLLLPLIPAIRRGLTGRDLPAQEARTGARSVRGFVNREEEDPGDVRAYMPGDPVSRIHWKLTAKRDEVLVRESGRDMTEEEAEKKAETGRTPPDVRFRKDRAFRAGFFILSAALVLLFALPPALQGMKALMNRLFEASEAVNAYAYERFAVSGAPSEGLAAALLAVMTLALLGMTLLSGSRGMALGLLAGSVLFQVYFGLPFPGWVNGGLFALFVLWMIRRPWERKTVLSALAGMTAAALAVSTAWPGVDPATEAASESVRDLLSRMAQSVTGAAWELPEGENEIRHAHTRSPETGDREARTEREFRQVTEEEEQISRPRWTDYLRMALLLLLTAALPILPFLPFILLNRRRKKAAETRKAFRSPDVREAVFAVFQQVIRWLEATGNGGGNAPYAEWHADLSPDYGERFARCEKLFEEAAYSTHEMREEQRRQVLELLEETERILLRKAGRMERLRLRYRECLWE